MENLVFSFFLLGIAAVIALVFHTEGWKKGKKDGTTWHKPETPPDLANLLAERSRIVTIVYAYSNTVEVSFGYFNYINSRWYLDNWDDPIDVIAWTYIPDYSHLKTPQPDVKFN